MKNHSFVCLILLVKYIAYNFLKSEQHEIFEIDRPKYLGPLCCVCYTTTFILGVRALKQSLLLL